MSDLEQDIIKFENWKFEKTIAQINEAKAEGKRSIEMKTYLLSDGFFERLEALGYKHNEGIITW